MSFGGNWVDLAIILILGYYASLSFRSGFLYILADFSGFLLSLVLALRIYQFTAIFLKNNFDLSPSVSNAMGFIATALILEMLLNYIFNELLKKLPSKVLKSKFNKWLGLLPAVGEGLLITAFILTAIIALPVRPDLKKDVSESKIGGYILKQTSGLEKTINRIFGGAVNNALTYFTFEPNSRQTLKLTTGKPELSVDEASESSMLNDLNNERVSRGLNPLMPDASYRTVARDYARDMWMRNYFSHYSPEGESVADRFDKAGINYFVAGENLALAPTEETAHTGLMNSEGHKANILEPEFKKVGIGVIDNGIYGKIFVQVFSD